MRINCAEALIDFGDELQNENLRYFFEARGSIKVNIFKCKQIF